MSVLGQLYLLIFFIVVVSVLNTTFFSISRGYLGPPHQGPPMHHVPGHEGRGPPPHEMRGAPLAEPRPLMAEPRGPMLDQRGPPLDGRGKGRLHHEADMWL